MEFEIACTCGQHMLVEAQFVGQDVECPGCGGFLTVPEPPKSGQPAPVVTPAVSEPPPPPPAPPTSPETPPAVGRPPTASVGYPGYPPVERRVHGKAIAALICGILGIFACPFVLSIISLVLAGQAKREIRERPDVFGGMGLATAGQICAIVGLALTCLMSGCFFLGAA